MTYVHCYKCKDELGTESKGITNIHKPLVLYRKKVMCRSCYPGTVKPVKEKKK